MTAPKRSDDRPKQSDDLYPLTREKLYELAWSEPMLSIAKKYDVSSSFLARICTRMNVPRPAPGYWTKVECGKKVAIPPLPEARPEDELQWDRYSDVSEPPRPRKKPKRSTKVRRPSRETGPRKRPNTHRLLSGAKAHFLKTRDPRNGYLRPYKKILVDMIVSENGLDQALRFANQIFLALEDKGYRVLFSPANEYRNRPRIDEREKPPKKDNRDLHHDSHWAPYRSTLVQIDELAFGLTVIELSQNVEVEYSDGDWVPVKRSKQRRSNRYGAPWTSHRDLPSGRFCLQAYSPYPGTNWLQRWDLPTKKDATKLGHKIAGELAGACPEIRSLIEQEERRREEWRREWDERERKREQERLVKLWNQANQASQAQIEKIIADWSESKRIESFFEEVTRSISQLPASDQSVIRGRIDLIMEFVGQPDALEELRQWRSPREIMASIDEPLPDSAVKAEDTPL